MPDSAAARRRISIQGRLLAAFTQQLPLKATAILLAVILWFVVNAKEPQLELVPVRLTTLLDSSLVLRDSLPPLQALVAGAPKELIKLNSTPPVIRRQISGRGPDTVVIDLRPGDVTLPDGVDAVVRDVQPRSVTLRFESMWTKRVPVRSSIDIAAGPSLGPAAGPITTEFEPGSVLITGPRHLLTGIPSVHTVKATIAFPDSLPHLIDIDTVGFGPVRARPSQVKVHLKLLPHT